MPEGSPGKYFIGRIRGGDVAAVGSRCPRARRRSRCGTPTSGSTAPTRPRRRSRAAGGTVLTEPFDIFDAGRMAVVRRPGGRGVRRLAAEAAQGATGRQRARRPQLQRPPHPRPGGRQGVLRRGVRLGDAGCRRAHVDAARRTATTSRSATPGRASRWRQMGGPERLRSTSSRPQPDRRRGHRHAGALGRHVRGRRRRRDRRRGAELGGDGRRPARSTRRGSRMAVIRDPQGATFTASQFVPENKDIEPAPADAAA